MDLAIAIGRVGPKEWQVSLVRMVDGQLKVMESTTSGKMTAAGRVEGMLGLLKHAINWQGKLPGEK